MPTTDDPITLLIVGLGTMGAEIALQAARFGVNVVGFDPAPDAAQHFQSTQEKLLAEWVSSKLIAPGDAAPIAARIRCEPDPALAARHADLLIEATPENAETKLAVFRQFDALAPPAAIFATSTSYLTPSMLLEGLSPARAPQFAAFHFHEPVWYANVVDVMPHPATSPATVDWLIAFARRLQQIPILCRRERPGYVGNALLDAVLGAAILRVVDGVAPVDDVDRAWMGMMKTPIGPFGILDRIGLDTAYDIMEAWQDESPDPRLGEKMDFLKQHVDAGRRGLKAGRGFYEYPNPDFARPDFLQRARHGGPSAADLPHQP